MTTIYNIIILVSFLILFAACCVYSLYVFIDEFASSYTRRKAFSRLNNGFNSNPPYDENDIRICFERYSWAFHSYYSFLDTYLDRLDENVNHKVNDYKYVKSIIIKLREEALEKEPFAELEGNERILMDGIYEAVSADPNTKRIAKDKLDYLSRSIVKTNKELKKAQKNNKYTIPLAIISIIVTIISLFSRVKLSKTEFEQMKNTVKESIAEQLNSNDEATINLEDVNNKEEQ